MNADNGRYVQSYDTQKKRLVTHFFNYIMNTIHISLFSESI